MIDILLRYDTRIINSKKIIIYTDENRIDLIYKLSAELNGVYKRCDPGSSIGCIQMESSRVYIKPISTNPGIDNERNFFSMVKRYIDNGGRRIRIGNKIIRGVKSISMTSSRTGDNRKADIVLETRYGEVPISIKKLNAERWASTDVIHGKQAKVLLHKMIDSSLVELSDYSDDGRVKRLSRPIARKLKDCEIDHVVFGSDILKRGVVIVNNFTRDDFRVKRGILYIRGEVLQTSDDVKNTDRHPYMMIRNDSCRRSKALPYGVRVEVVFKSRITKNTIIYEE